MLKDTHGRVCCCPRLAPILLSTIAIGCLSPLSINAQCNELLVALRGGSIISFKSLDGCAVEVDPEIFDILEQMIGEAINNRDGNRIGQIANLIDDIHQRYISSLRFNSASVRRETARILAEVTKAHQEMGHPLLPATDGSRKWMDQAVAALRSMASGIGELGDSGLKKAEIEKIVDDRISELLAREATLGPKRSPWPFWALGSGIVIFATVFVWGFIRLKSWTVELFDRHKTPSVIRTVDSYIRSQFKGQPRSLSDLVREVKSVAEWVRDQKMRIHCVEAEEPEPDSRPLGPEQESGHEQERVESIQHEISSLRNAFILFREEIESRLKEPAAIAWRERAMPIEEKSLGIDVGQLARAMIPLERELVRVMWSRFSHAFNRSEMLLSKVLRLGDEWQHMTEVLLLKLPRSVFQDPNLLESLEKVLGEVRAVHLLTRRLAILKPYLYGSLANLPNDVEELARARDLSGFLAELLNSIEATQEVVRFEASEWVNGRFRGFADMFFRYYFKAQAKGESEQLEMAHVLVREVLAWGKIEPVEVELGRSRYDEREHVVRAMTGNADLPDGVIVDIVRCGFRRPGGEILQQPEVIVNRLR